MALDTQIFFFLNNLAGQSPFLDGSILLCASYLAYILIGLFLVWVFFSHYSRREKITILFVASIATLVARFGVTELIRFFVHRPRPFVDLSVNQLLTSTEWSFPSGHATFFFALSTVVYLYNKKWGIGFFIATILMTVGRVIAGIHYPSDILAGALIGIAVAVALYYTIHSLICRRLFLK